MLATANKIMAGDGSNGPEASYFRIIAGLLGNAADTIGII